MAFLLSLVTAGAVAFAYVFASRNVFQVVLMLGVAALGGIACVVVRGSRGRGWIAGVTVTAVAGVMVASMLTGAALEHEQEPQVAAVSPGGHYELLRIRVTSMGPGKVVVRVRSRDGWRHRVAGEDLVCLGYGDEDGPPPERYLQGVRFTGETGVQVTTGDGATWDTTFDGRTLLASSRLSKGCDERGRGRYSR